MISGGACSGFSLDNRTSLAIKKVNFGFWMYRSVDHNLRAEGRHRQVCRRGGERSRHRSVFCHFQ